MPIRLVVTFWGHLV